MAPFPENSPSGSLLGAPHSVPLLGALLVTSSPNGRRVLPVQAPCISPTAMGQYSAIEFINESISPETS